MKISVLTLATALGAAGLPQPNHCPLEGDCSPGIVLPMPDIPENELYVPLNPLNTADEARTNVDLPDDAARSPRPHKPVPLLNTDSTVTPSVLPDFKRQIFDIWIFGQSTSSADGAAATGAVGNNDKPKVNIHLNEGEIKKPHPPTAPLASSDDAQPKKKRDTEDKRQIFDIWIFGQSSLSPSALAWAPSATATTLSTAIVPAKHKRQPEVGTNPAAATTELPIATAEPQSKRQIFDIWIFGQKTSSAAPEPTSTTEDVKDKRQIFDIWIFGQKTSSASELPMATVAPKSKRQIFDIWIFGQKTSSATELPTATSTAEAKNKRQIFDIWIFGQKTSPAAELPTAAAGSTQVLQV